MLYWGEDEDKEECKVCKTSRWQQNDKQVESGHGSTPTKPPTKLPTKIL